jgi:hypothetical protein
MSEDVFLNFNSRGTLLFIKIKCVLINQLTIPEVVGFVDDVTPSEHLRSFGRMSFRRSISSDSVDIRLELRRLFGVGKNTVSS